MRRASGRFTIEFPTLTPTVDAAVEDNGVRLAIRFGLSRRHHTERPLFD
jgi:hypothetical protein